jgi:flagellar motor component MotA
MLPQTLMTQPKHLPRSSNNKHMEDAIARLEALALEARQMGLLSLAAKLEEIIADIVAIEDGRDMGPNLGSSNILD